jgi:hypothetical protein
VHIAGLSCKTRKKDIERPCKSENAGSPISVNLHTEPNTDGYTQLLTPPWQ